MKGGKKRQQGEPTCGGRRMNYVSNRKEDERKREREWKMSKRERQKGEVKALDEKCSSLSV